jgi:uncharacterized membrane protein
VWLRRLGVDAHTAAVAGEPGAPVAELVFLIATDHSHGLSDRDYGCVGATTSAATRKPTLPAVLSGVLALRESVR